MNSARLSAPTERAAGEAESAGDTRIAEHFGKGYRVFRKQSTCFTYGNVWEEMISRQANNHRRVNKNAYHQL